MLTMTATLFVRRQQRVMVVQSQVESHRTLTQPCFLTTTSCMFNNIASATQTLARYTSIKATWRKCGQNCRNNNVVKLTNFSGVRQLSSSTSSSPSTPTPSSTISRLKHPTRGGQNLSKRYERLERSARGKEAYTRLREGNAELGTAGSSNAMAGGGSESLKKQPMMFEGFVVPEEPKEPGPDGK